jgi:hypothetical protein
MTLNLAKVRPGALTPTDLFITVAMLDTQSVVLSAVLSSKDALASRWYIVLTAVVQCFVWIVVLIASTKLHNPSFYHSEDFCCLRETWMSSSFHACGPKIELRFTFLAYWITHIYDTVQSTMLAMQHMTLFDSLEKIDREHQNSGATDHSQEVPPLYSRLPSTVFSNWQGFVLYPLLVIMAIEGHINRNSVLTPSSREWGQTFAIMACVCGLSHWLFVQRKNLKALVEHYRDNSVRGHSSVSLKRPVNEMRFFMTVAEVEYVPTKIGEAAYGNIRLGEKDAQLLRAAAF